MTRLWLLLALAAACTDDAGSDGPLAVGACDGLLHGVDGEPGTHVAVGTQIEWSTNPPATGAHYGQWAGWDRYYENLERGTWMHNAEHGGVILLYRCPDGCPDVVDALITSARNAAPDASCTAPVTKRVIVAGDPLLPDDVQVAAVAWNRYYTASCFDRYVDTFLRAQYGKGPEDLCADGNPFGGVPLTP